MPDQDHLRFALGRAGRRARRLARRIRRRLRRHLGYRFERHGKLHIVRT